LLSEKETKTLAYCFPSIDPFHRRRPGSLNHHRFKTYKVVKLGWVSGTIALLGGAFILAVFLAMFNSLTPSGSFVVVARVVEVTPNVSGQVMAIPIKPNEPVRKGAISRKLATPRLRTR
jgi:multidrug resistance efflux pump